jgi:hypothetical protein
METLQLLLNDNLFWQDIVLPVGIWLTYGGANYCRLYKRLAQHFNHCEAQC